MRAKYDSPSLRPRLQREDGRLDAQNFMEMVFDTGSVQPGIHMTIRHLADDPADEPRGGGMLDLAISRTGRPLSCRLPRIKTPPSAEVTFYALDGKPLRATLSGEDGYLTISGLVDVAPGADVVMTSRRHGDLDSRLIQTLPL